MLSRNEMVNLVLQLYDEIEQLQQKPVEIKTIEKEINIQLQPIERHFIEIGRERLYEKTFYSYRSISVKRNENGELVFQSFEDWFNNGFRPGEIPEDMSRSDFVKAMKPTYLKHYEEDKAKALNQFLEKEKKEAETPKEEDEG